MLSKEKVVEERGGVELELQQRRAKVSVSRGPDHQIDGFCITSEPQDGRRENVATTAFPASQIQNESSQALLRIVPDKPREDVKVETMHISCKSHTFKKDHNYAGLIIFQYNGKSDWRTANGTHCKCGYIVIQDKDSKDISKYKKQRGGVHGAVYRNAFGESSEDAEVVAEAFSVSNGHFLRDTFLNRPQIFIKPTKEGVLMHCVEKIVKYWKKVGSSRLEKRNFVVKELTPISNFIARDSDAVIPQATQEWRCSIL